MAEVHLGGVPFEEAIDHFRGKLNITTRHWDDLLGQTHARAFTVAGATKTALLHDLREAVDQAIAQGENITDFRRRFDDTVRAHGWSYKGSRGWRTRVIYDTNLRTAHAAGRWAQIERTQETRPYLQYLTVGDDRVRPEHQRWDLMVLPVDHPWWNTHYPPNDWGCRCTVRTLSREQMESEGLSPAEEAPDLNPSERVNTDTGEIYGEVPEGVGTGWDYNVGKAWLGPDAAWGQALAQMAPDLRDAALSTAGLAPVLSGLRTDFRRWAERALRAPHAKGSIATAGYLNADIVRALESRGIQPSTVLVTVSDARLRRMRRDLKQRLGAALADEDMLRLPEIISSPQAVLFDIRNPALLYVFGAGVDEHLGKLVVRVNFREKGEISNSIRSGGLVHRPALQDSNQYTLIQGGL